MPRSTLSSTVNRKLPISTMGSILDKSSTYSMETRVADMVADSADPRPSGVRVPRLRSFSHLAHRSALTTPDGPASDADGSSVLTAACSSAAAASSAAVAAAIVFSASSSAATRAATTAVYALNAASSLLNGACSDSACYPGQPSTNVFVLWQKLSIRFPHTSYGLPRLAPRPSLHTPSTLEPEHFDRKGRGVEVLERVEKSNAVCSSKRFPG